MLPVWIPICAGIRRPRVEDIPEGEDFNIVAEIGISEIRRSIWLSIIRPSRKIGSRFFSTSGTSFPVLLPLIADSSVAQ